MFTARPVWSHLFHSNMTSEYTPPFDLRGPRRRLALCQLSRSWSTMKREGAEVQWSYPRAELLQGFPLVGPKTDRLPFLRIPFRFIMNCLKNPDNGCDPASIPGLPQSGWLPQPGRLVSPSCKPFRYSTILHPPFLHYNVFRDICSRVTTKISYNLKWLVFQLDIVLFLRFPCRSTLKIGWLPPL